MHENVPKSIVVYLKFESYTSKNPKISQNGALYRRRSFYGVRQTCKLSREIQARESLSSLKISNRLFHGCATGSQPLVQQAAGVKSPVSTGPGL